MTIAYDRLRRRSTRRHTLALGVLLLAVTWGLVVTLVGSTRALLTPTPAPLRSSASLGLPDRLPNPGYWTPTASGHPRGRASILMSGSGHPYYGPGDTSAVAVVGPGGYRMTDRLGVDEQHPGEDTLLSPDGGQLVSYTGAWGGGGSVVVQDLLTGRRRSVPVPDSHTVVGWMPDRRTLIAAGFKSRTVALGQTSSTERSGTELGLIDIASGTYRRLAPLAGILRSTGPVAVSADGGRIAYQSGDKVAVLDVPTGAELMAVSVAPGTLLGGKGAWSPGGRSLALVVPVSTQASQQSWQVQLVDTTTGTVHGPAYAVVDDATALRTQGWTPGGELVAVAYRPERHVLSSGALDATSFASVRRADLVGLRPGGAAPRTILRPQEQVLAMDVAQDAVRSGLTYEAVTPARISLPRVGYGVVSLAMLGLVLAEAIVVRRRFRRVTPERTSPLEPVRAGRARRRGALTSALRALLRDATGAGGRA